MLQTKTLLPQIIKKLQELKIYKIILFGSHAWGTPGKDSDLDLIVVTKENFQPQNYEEEMQLYLKVSQHIWEFKKQIPIDLIVYTKVSFQKFIELKSIFAKEVLAKGKFLYEDPN